MTSGRWSRLPAGGRVIGASVRRRGGACPGAPARRASLLRWGLARHPSGARDDPRRLHQVGPVVGEPGDPLVLAEPGVLAPREASGRDDGRLAGAVLVELAVQVLQDLPVAQ